MAESNLASEQLMRTVFEETAALFESLKSSTENVVKAASAEVEKRLAIIIIEFRTKCEALAKSEEKDGKKTLANLAKDYLQTISQIEKESLGAINDAVQRAKTQFNEALKAAKNTLGKQTKELEPILKEIIKFLEKLAADCQKAIKDFVKDAQSSLKDIKELYLKFGYGRLLR